MNAWRTPKHILHAHPPDQCPQIRANWRPSSWIARFPVPVATKPSTMPAHQCLGPNDRDGLEDRREPSIQQDEEQTIFVRQLDPTTDLSPQHDQLISERSVLGLKRTRRLEREGQEPDKKQQQLNQGHMTLRDSVTRSIRTGFSVHTGRLSGGHRDARRAVGFEHPRDILFQQVDRCCKENDVLHQEGNVAGHRRKAGIWIPAVRYERNDGDRYHERDDRSHRAQDSLSLVPKSQKEKGPEQPFGGAQKPAGAADSEDWVQPENQRRVTDEWYESLGLILEPLLIPEQSKNHDKRCANEAVIKNFCEKTGSRQRPYEPV